MYPGRLTFAAILGLCLVQARTLQAQGLVERIDSLRIAEGPLEGAYRLQENDGRLNWYFNNLGLLPVCRERPAAVREYLDLYLKNVRSSTGTIDDIRDIATGSRGQSDSDDSYAATMLSLAAEYRRVSGDRRWWKANQAKLKQIAHKVLVDTQKKSGLVPMRAADKTGLAYLMDNCEVYRGLADLNEILTRENDPEAGLFREAADRVSKGVVDLYDEQRGAFRYADIPGDSTFYPLRAAQVFPEAFGVPLGDEDQTKRRYDAAWKFMKANGDRWERGDVKDGSLGGYPWMVLGFVAAKRGDIKLAKAQQDYFVGKSKNEPIPPAFTAIHEIGWTLRIQNLLDRYPQRVQRK